MWPIGSGRHHGAACSPPGQKVGDVCVASSLSSIMSTERLLLLLLHRRRRPLACSTPSDLPDAFATAASPLYDPRLATRLHS